MGVGVGVLVCVGGMWVGVVCAIYCAVQRGERKWSEREGEEGR